MIAPETSDSVARDSSFQVRPGESAIEELPIARPPGLVTTLWWLSRDTFRQARASKVLLLALIMAGLGIGLCLSVRVEGPPNLRLQGSAELLDPRGRPLTHLDAEKGTMTIGFGIMRVGQFRGAEDQVRFLQALLALWAAGVIGTLIVLAGTAGLLPESLKPSAAAVLFAKPISRTVLILGKILGVLTFVATLSLLFVGGTWVALGIRTGIWPLGYLATWPILMTQFASLYAVSALAAVATRNTAAALFAPLAFWLVCFGTNQAHETLRVQQETTVVPRITRVAVGAAYWALPKPIDFVQLLEDALESRAHFTSAVSSAPSRPKANFATAAASIGTSLLFASILFCLAARQSQTTDY
jgi:hypothetical protein